ncbi:MAG: prolyl oligopeptidase family serine peptidase [Gemmatimonadales bacterium]
MRWLLAVLLLATGAAPLAGQRRPVAIEDYYRLASIGSPVISPDGAWVAYLVTRRVESNGSEPRRAYVIATDGRSAPTPLGSEEIGLTGVDWTHGTLIRVDGPDGPRYFLPDGSTAETPPLPPDAVVGPDWRYGARVRRIREERAPAQAGSEFERRHLERFKGADVDWLEFQRDGVPFPAPDPTRAASGEIHLLAAGGADRQLTRLGLVPRSLTWSPRGDFLAFLADSGFRTEQRYGRADLWTVSVEGAVKRLTADDGLDRRSPAVSPDGRWISYVESWGTDRIVRERLDHGGPTDLMVMPADGGPARNLTPDWDLQAGAPAWSRDGRHLYFEAAIGGERHLFRVPARGGPVEQVTQGPRRLGDFTMDSAQRRMTYLAATREAPAEIFVAATDGTGERQLTHLADDWLAEIATARSERIRFPSADGTMIEGWVTLPTGYRADGGPYPLIVSSHGGPHSASGYDFDFKTQYFAANGYLVLETNFRSSTGYGEKFLWATWGQWGTLDGQDVQAGMEYVAANYPVDRRRVGATGHSYGGFMTNWLITHYPASYAAAVSGAGISNWMSDYGTADVARTKETEFFGTPWQPEARERMLRQSPLIYADRVRTPTLFVHGALDQRVPYEEAEQMYVALKKNGVPARMVVYPDQYHGIRGPWNVVHRMLVERAWWDRWLKGLQP